MLSLTPKQKVKCKNPHILLVLRPLTCNKSGLPDLAVAAVVHLGSIRVSSKTFRQESTNFDIPLTKDTIRSMVIKQIGTLVTGKGVEQ